MVELQARKRIKCLRTDNGDEYYSNDFVKHIFDISSC